MALKRFRSDDDFGEFYRRNGYVVLTDAFSKEALERAKGELFDLFQSRFAALGEEGDGEELLTSQYARNRDAWRQCATRTWDLPSVHGLAVGEEIRGVLARLGLRKPLISTRPEVRTDMPGDVQYVQPWHQDWRSGQGSLNAVTFWIPLHDVTMREGAIELIPGSHLWGYLEAEELTNPRRFQIVDERVETAEAVAAELEFGEAIAFSQFLAHRSGENTSGRPRLTTQQRFSDHAESRFAAAGFPTPVGSELVWGEPPTDSDLARAFGFDEARA